MNIILISPAATQSSNGNFTTAIRWKKILNRLGHNVELKQNYNGNACDLMIALHAWRSADAINLYKSRHPKQPLIVALTGTDAYRFVHSHPQQTLRSIKLADRLIGLHRLIKTTVPIEYQDKLRIIFQASTLKPIRPVTNKKHFNICIAGHLREEKDPLRVAYAVRNLPDYSKIKVSHFGKAHSEQWARYAHTESIKNKRYRWFGEISQSMLRIKLAHSKLMVLPSRMEGGANIISEAIMLDLPVVASRIDGSIGLLGEDYSGYYDVENTQQLKKLLLHCENDKKFYHTLIKQCRSRRYLFSAYQETRHWKQILSELI